LVELIFKFIEIPFGKEDRESVRIVFSEDIGKSFIYRVYARFKKKRGRRTSIFPMIYDTGAIVSLLPSRMSELIGIEKYAEGGLRGAISEWKLDVRYCKVDLFLEDERGNRSSEITAWRAIVAIPSRMRRYTPI
jgi:hypothetical protein